MPDDPKPSSPDLSSRLRELEAREAELNRRELKAMARAHLAKKGLGVILVSSELPEIIGLSDRIIVMRGRSIAGEVPGKDATEDKLLALGMAENIG